MNLHKKENVLHYVLEAFCAFLAQQKARPKAVAIHQFVQVLAELDPFLGLIHDYQYKSTYTLVVNHTAFSLAGAKQECKIKVKCHTDNFQLY